MTRYFLKATLLALALGCSTAVAAPPSSAIAAGLAQASTLDNTDVSAQRRAVRRTTVIRGPAGGVAVRRATVVRPGVGRVGWARPGNYYWRRGGAIAAGGGGVAAGTAFITAVAGGLGAAAGGVGAVLAAGALDDSRKCAACNGLLDESAAFCPQCGTKAS